MGRVNAWVAAKLQPMAAALVNSLTDAELSELAALPGFILKAIVPAYPCELKLDGSRLLTVRPTTVHGKPGFAVREASPYSVNTYQAFEVNSKLVKLVENPYDSYKRASEGVLAAKSWSPLSHDDNLNDMRVKAAWAAERFCRTRSNYRREEYTKEVAATKTNFQLYTKVFGLTNTAPLLDPKLEGRVYKRQAITKLEGNT